MITECIAPLLSCQLCFTIPCSWFFFSLGKKVVGFHIAFTCTFILVKTSANSSIPHFQDPPCWDTPLPPFSTFIIPVDVCWGIKSLSLGSCGYRWVAYVSVGSHTLCVHIGNTNWFQEVINSKDIRKTKKRMWIWEEDDVGQSEE